MKSDIILSHMIAPELHVLKQFSIHPHDDNMYIRNILDVPCNLVLISSEKEIIITKPKACHVLKRKDTIKMPDGSFAMLEYEDKMNKALLAGEKAAILRIGIILNVDYQLECWQISRNHSSFTLLTNVSKVHQKVTSFKLDVQIPPNDSFLPSSGDFVTLSEGQCFINLPVEFTRLPFDVIPNQSCEKTQYQYRITDRQLGEGTFGRVFLAFNVTKRRQVACKVVSRDYTEEQKECAFSDDDLIREYNLLSKLGKHV